MRASLLTQPGIDDGLSACRRAVGVVSITDGVDLPLAAHTEHPLWPLMSQIVVETYGLAPLLRNLLAELHGIREAYIYGSWAGRRGQPGLPLRDIDALVVRSPPRTDLLDVADTAQQQLHTEVNIPAITPGNGPRKTSPSWRRSRPVPSSPLVRPGTAGD